MMMMMTVMETQGGREGGEVPPMGPGRGGGSKGPPEREARRGCARPAALKGRRRGRAGRV